MTTTFRLFEVLVVATEYLEPNRALPRATPAASRKNSRRLRASMWLLPRPEEAVGLLFADIGCYARSDQGHRFSDAVSSVLIRLGRCGPPFYAFPQPLYLLKDCN